MKRGREEHGACANVRSDDVRTLEPEGVGDANDELTHGSRGEQTLATLRMPEARKVYGNEMCVLRQTRPGRLEREQALGPRVEQQRLALLLLALGVTNRQTVDRSEPRLNRSLQRRGHGVLSRSSPNVVLTPGARVMSETRARLHYTMVSVRPARLDTTWRRSACGARASC